MSRTILVLCGLGLALALVSHAQSDLQVFVDLHNKARREVGVGPVRWNSTLEAYATAYSKSRSTHGCKLVHSHGPYGENLYWGHGAGFIDENAALRSWVDEEKDYYDYKSNSCLKGKQCLHYTQVIWKNTKQIGCGSSACPDASMFITCSYYPPGNIIGERPY